MPQTRQPPVSAVFEPSSSHCSVEYILEHELRYLLGRPSRPLLWRISSDFHLRFTCGYRVLGEMAPAASPSDADHPGPATSIQFPGLHPLHGSQKAIRVVGIPSR